MHHPCIHDYHELCMVVVILGNGEEFIKKSLTLESTVAFELAVTLFITGQPYTLKVKAKKPPTHS